MEGAIHEHEFCVYADAMRPFEGSETADEKIAGEVAVGDIFCPQSRDTGLRETKMQQRVTIPQTRVALKHNRPQDSRSGN